MFRTLGLVIIGLLISQGARSSPLTIYTNEADWLAAVSGSDIAPYHDPVTGFQSFVTVQLMPDGYCCIISPPTYLTIGAFNSLNATFSLTAIDTGYAETYTSDLFVSFSTPILGFASLDASGETEGPILVNGVGLPPTPIKGFLGVNGFFGVAGYINSLTFTGYNTTDENAFITLDDIVVATVEPSTLAALITGLLILMWFNRRYAMDVGGTFARFGRTAVPALCGDEGNDPFGESHFLNFAGHRAQIDQQTIHFRHPYERVAADQAGKRPLRIE